MACRDGPNIMHMHMHGVVIRFRPAARRSLLYSEISTSSGDRDVIQLQITCSVHDIKLSYYLQKICRLGLPFL